METRDILIYLSVKYNGEWRDIMAAVKRQEQIGMAALEEAGAKYGKGTITIVDKEYPEYLKHVCCPPFVLFFKGDISLIQDRRLNVGVVGSRDVIPYCAKATKTICDGMSKKGIRIVSGLARGIDTVALTSAERYGKAIAVLGNGIDYEYPSENRELQRKIGDHGLLISEYPDATPPRQDHFPFRNRLVAGFSNALLIGQVTEHSGTLTTVAHKLDGAGQVAVIPTAIDSGLHNNELIRQGAHLVQSTSDMIDLLDLYGESFEELVKKSSGDL